MSRRSESPSRKTPSPSRPLSPPVASTSTRHLFQNLAKTKTSQSSKNPSGSQSQPSDPAVQDHLADQSLPISIIRLPHPPYFKIKSPSSSTNTTPPPVVTTASSTTSTTMATSDPKIAHVQKHNALIGRTKVFQDKIKKHKTVGQKPLTLIEIELFLEDLKILGQEVSQQQMNCYKLYEDTDTSNELTRAINTHALLDDAYNEVRTELTTLSKSLNPADGNSKLKIPKFTLPRFDGNHAKWPSFKNEFTTLIIDVPSFSKSEKLRLLTDSLRDSEAYDHIKDLTIVDGHWDEAWTRMQRRYDSPLEAVHAACQPLFDFPPLISQTESGTHRLVNAARTTRAQIANINLGPVTEGEALLVYLLMTKADKRTLQELNLSLENNDVPSFQTVIDNYEKQAKNISLTKELKINNPISQQQTNRSRRDKYDRKVLMATQSDDYTSCDSDVSRSSRRSISKKTKKKKVVVTRKRSVSFKKPISSYQKKPALQLARRKSSRQSTSRETSRDSSRNRSSSYQRYSAPSNSQPCSFCGHWKHRLFSCPGFSALNIAARKDWAKNNRRCFNCLAKHLFNECTSTRTCQLCSKKHNTLLHDENKSKTSNSPSTSNHTVVNPTTTECQEVGLLPTAVVDVLCSGRTAPARCLLDSGAQSSFITEKFVKKLKLPLIQTNQEFTVAGGKTVPTLGKTSFLIQSQLKPEKTFKIEAHVLPEITSDIPFQPVEIHTWNHLKQLPLADPNFNTPGPIEILFGTSVFDKILGSKKVKGTSGTPSGYSTDLGYIVMGTVTMSGPRVINTILNIDMQKFWEVEEMPMKKPMTPSEKFCEEHFKRTYMRLPTGQYQIRWPFKINHLPLGDSRTLATQRYYSVERSLLRKPGLHDNYNNQFMEYIQLKQMELVPIYDLNKPAYYLPHHAVIKESSTTTKVRVVFDASAKTSNGVSLNDILEPGPTIQRDLFDHLLEFRLKAIAMVADIEKMYRQILVHPEERDFLRILWRKSPSEPLQTYKMNVIPFGTSPAPFLACRVLVQLAMDEQKDYPLAALAILRSFYMDDLMRSELNNKIAIELQNQLRAALLRGHFDLRKWSSNSQALLSNIAPELRETQIPLTIDDSDSIKTLGLKWKPFLDFFFFILNLDLSKKHTKRTLLSDISKIFDPLGFLAPIIIFAKIILQKIWQRNLGWDDDLPNDILQIWINFAEQLVLIEKLKIPRCLQYDDKFKWELHGFCDASEKAYAAVIYLRGQYNNKVIINLVVSKTRVAPLKILTIPRLEMQGAVLLANLMHHVKNAWDIQIEAVHFWTDSTICLNWIYSSPTRWKIFIANRVTQIQELSESSQWHHIESSKNPADCASRGVEPSQIIDHPLWWKGPEFLNQPSYNIVPFDPHPQQKEEEKKVVVTINKTPEPATTTLLQRLEKISSWKKIIKVVSVLNRICEKKSFCTNTNFTPFELETAERKVAWLIQQATYSTEIKALQQNKQNIGDRRFRALNVFLDPEGLIRVGGRLQNSSLPYSARHQILLPGHHPIVKLMILYHHQKLAHAGKQTINNHIRYQYWIPNGSKTIKSVIDKCLVCFRYNAKPMEQLMGQLPACRVNQARPFLKVGVDFAGPFTLSNFTGRKSNQFKVWICIFTCLVTRAIHLEISTSLSQESFLLALRRFMSRRGRPSDIYSDNGTNFVGAENILTKNATELKALQDYKEKILPDIMLEKIQWHFNPPRAPHQGGVWEICVKLIKVYLYKIMQHDSYNYEEFLTIINFVEALVNSRPLTPLSNDPNDLEALTPAHFLTGTSLLLPPEHSLRHLKLNRLDLYQLILRRFEDLWIKWQDEYLVLLQKRQKWQTSSGNLQNGDLVLIIDDQLPPLKWRLGRVKRIHPGKDGLTRVSTIESEGNYKDEKGEKKKVIKEFIRPISKLAKLPIETNDQEEVAPELEIPVPEPEPEPKQINVVTKSSMSPCVWIIAMICMFSTLAGQAQAENFDDPNQKPIMDSTSTDWIFNCTFIRLLTNLLLILTAGKLKGKIISILMLFMIGGVVGNYDPKPNLFQKFPQCDTRFENYGEVPLCVTTIRWLHVLPNANVCSREIECHDNKMLSSEGKYCVPKSPACKDFITINMDEIECQTEVPNANEVLLERPEIKSSYCAVDSYSLKECRHFVEEFSNVSVVISNNKVYPLASIHIQQQPQLDQLSSYNCEGRCPNKDCKAGDCTGDKAFCNHFQCNNNSPCNCTYNSATDLYKIHTNDGEIYPECWGTMYLPVKREDLSRTKKFFDCQNCQAHCSRTGVTVTTPHRVPLYVKAHKNPGFVSTIPTSTTTNVQFTKNMLAASGKVELEVWFKDYDYPSTLALECDRVSICDLITCHICFEQWANVSCYSTYHWVLVSILGVILTAITLTIIYVTRFMMTISWWLFWPFRKCLQAILARQHRKRNYQPIFQDTSNDEESGIPLMKRSNPYNSTVVTFDKEKHRKRRMPTPALLPGVQTLFLILCISTATQGCANFASMSAASRECHYSNENKIICSVRINTRLSLSPVGQTSCFRIEDAKNNLLGTISIETKSVALKCMKQLLYYVPRAVSKCQSSLQCYNLYSSAECHGYKCQEFGVNDTVRAFKDSTKHLGWSSCQEIRHPQCPFFLTRDCNFIRLSINNPTNEAYSVFDCPQWTFAVRLQSTLRLGDRVVQNTSILTAGLTTKIDDIDFTLISVSAPPTPILNECILSKGKQSALAPCNTRGEVSLNKLGEIQCNTLKDAQEANQNCFASVNLIRAIPDSSGVKCLSDLISPAKLLEERQLPLKLANGVLVPHEDSITFESSANTLLEIQLNTENLQLVKQIQESTCTAEFIKIEGCYSCLPSATMIIEAKVEEGNNLAALECPEAGFFIPIHLTDKFEKHQIIINLDTPEVNLRCQLRCSKNTVQLQVTGHLQYLANTDNRDLQMTVSYQPPDTNTGFNWLSLTGLGWYNWMIRGIVIVSIMFVCIITLITSLKLILRKLV